MLTVTFEGALDEAGDAVTDEAEPAFAGRARHGLGAKQAGHRLASRSTQLRGAQILRLAAFFPARAFGAGAQHAVASWATRLQSSGCPSQQSSTRNAITDRMPSTSER